MGHISEKEFLTPDPNNPNYSLVEYDLYAKTGLTIRKNLKTDTYEIITIKSPYHRVHMSKDINEIAKIANSIEGSENTFVKEE